MEQNGRATAKSNSFRNVEFTKARRLLVTNPRKVIQNAKNGSLMEIAAICVDAGTSRIPGKLMPLVEDMLETFMRKPFPGLNDPVNVVTLHKAIPFSFLLLGQLTGTGKYYDNEESQERLLKLWPHIFRWIDYVVMLTRVPELEDLLPGGNSQTSHILSIATALQSFSHCTYISRKTLGALETFRLAARIWVEPYTLTDTTNAHYASSCLNSFASCDRSEFERFDILSELLGGEGNVSALALRKLKIACTGTRLADGTKGEINHEAIAEHIQVLMLLCGGEPGNYHSLRKTILWDGAVTQIIRQTSKLLDEFELDERAVISINPCLSFFIFLFGTDDTPTWMRYAFKHDILGMLLKLGPVYDRMHYSTKGIIKKVMTHMNRYLHLQKVREAAASAFMRLFRSKPTTRRRVSREFNEMWETLENDVLIKVIVENLLSNGRKAGCETLCCGNPDCLFSGPRSSFMKCEWCSVLYCSRSCQRHGWGGLRKGFENHRYTCGKIRRESPICTLSSRDRQFMIAFALYEIRRHMPGLRAMAVEQCSGLIPLRVMGVRVLIHSGSVFMHSELLWCHTKPNKIGDHVRDVVLGRQEQREPVRLGADESHPPGKQTDLYVNIIFEDGRDVKAIKGNLYFVADLDWNMLPPTGVSQSKRANDDNFENGHRYRRGTATDFDHKKLEYWRDEVDDAIKRVQEESERRSCSIWEDQLIKLVVKQYITERDH